MNRFWSGLSISLLALACSGKSAKDGGGDAPQAISGGPSTTAGQFLALQSFPNCEETDLYLRNNLRRMLKDSLDQERQYFLGSQGYVADNQGAGNPVPASESASDKASSAPQDYSKTNTQVAGVDEPDIMKSNGTHIFTISGSEIQIVASWPADTMKLASKISVDGYPRDLFLTEDKRLVVASNPRVQDPVVPAWYSAPPWYRYGIYDYRILRLEVYDISQIEEPKLAKTYHFRGDYLNMRRQGNLLRLVMADHYPAYPEGVESYIPWWSGNSRISLEEFDRRRAEIDAKNEAVISQMTFNSWVNARRSYGADWQGLTDDPLYKEDASCASIYASEAMGNLGLTTVTSLDIGSGAIDQAALLSPANTIYASTDSLYVAYNQRSWWWGWGSPEGSKTYIHKFSYESPDSVRLLYQGSGMLDGFILNQFSMDEFEGHLRVAVTDDRHVAETDSGTGRPRFSTVNRVAILAAADQKLSVVGQTEDLAPGERIYSSRFNGAKGYVVTFRQVDPLYTLDLSDPKNPKVSGELKVNGFSSYIHMIDDNHLLTVGQDADPATGRVLGLKIAVFDVSDPSNPSEKFKHLIEDASYSWSEAQYDHHAFTYFASRGLLGIPIGGYRRTNSSEWWNDYFSELRVFGIDLEKGITNRGAIAMNDLYRAEKTEWGYWWGGAQVRRSVFADDFIYAISEAGIKAVHGDDLTNAVGSLSFYP